MEMIDIEDIAHALSHECRFGGMSRTFYSVAQHSVLVSHEVIHHADESWKPHLRILQLTGLLHDGTEAYLKDIPRPLKRLLPQYQDLEMRVWQVIAKRFMLTCEMPAEVKKADNQMLANEGHSLMYRGWMDSGIRPIARIGRIEAWDSKRAKKEFLHRFEELGGVR